MPVPPFIISIFVCLWFCILKKKQKQKQPLLPFSCLIKLDCEGQTFPVQLVRAPERLQNTHNTLMSSWSEGPHNLTALHHILRLPPAAGPSQHEQML